MLNNFANVQQINEEGAWCINVQHKDYNMSLVHLSSEMINSS